MQFRLAKPEDVEIVASVLCAAGANLREKGLDLWSAAEVSVAAVLPHINDGLYHVGFEGTEAVGVFRLQSHDQVFWPEIPDGTSAYLHKLAVLPSKQGQGLSQMLLEHALDITRSRSLDFLHLDCVGGRPKLRAVYEDFGFQHHSQKVLGGRVFERFALDVCEFDANPVVKRTGLRPAAYFER